MSKHLYKRVCPSVCPSVFNSDFALWTHLIARPGLFSWNATSLFFWVFSPFKSHLFLIFNITVVSEFLYVWQFSFAHVFVIQVFVMVDLRRISTNRRQRRRAVPIHHPKLSSNPANGNAQVRILSFCCFPPSLFSPFSFSFPLFSIFVFF